MSKKRTLLSDDPWADELDYGEIGKTLNNAEDRINKIEEKLGKIEEIITESKENDKTKDKQKDMLYKIKLYIAQPAIFALITTALFYMIITTYYINYFNRFSLPFFTLNLPLNFYLDAANNILLFMFYLCCGVGLIGLFIGHYLNIQ